MIASHIHDALDQVRKLQDFILEKRLFRGYSGKARIVSALVVLIGTVVLASGRVPARPGAHLFGWGIVCAICMLVNYLFLLYWFAFDEEVRRRPVTLKPALDALPALAVGGALTLALAAAERHDLLFGVWMCLYGLAQSAYKNSLPSGMYAIGLGYMACGIYCLLSPVSSFTNPWPMGLVFFAGELAGGTILIMKQRQYSRRNTS